jgi:hypothetical protein
MVVFRGPFHFSWDSAGLHAPVVNPSANVLMPDGILETMRRPLAEQWRRDKYRFENGWAPVAYFAWQDKSPDYFAHFARWSATTGKARLALLDNESPNVVPLFQTLLHRRSLMETFHRQIDLYPSQIRTYSQVNNPLVEPVFREYIITALSDPNHNDWSRNNTEGAVHSAIFQRIGLEGINQEDFAAWVASLPLPASSINLALRTIRLRSDEPLTFADQLQQTAGRGVLIETELTLDDLVNWFAENPEGNLHEFLEEQEENISVTDMSGTSRHRVTFSSFDLFDDGMFMDEMTHEQWTGLPSSFVRALLWSDTPEGDPQVRELIRRMWKHESTLSIVESAIIAKYGAINLRRGDQHATNIGSVHLPEYILDLYLLPEDAEEEETPRVRVGRNEMTLTLALCESPKAGEILERWLDVVGPAARPRIERSLEIWNTRNTLRQMRMEFFQDLVAGRIGPDDLLLPQPAWVWIDGEYVQGER